MEKIGRGFIEETLPSLDPVIAHETTPDGWRGLTEAGEVLGVRLIDRSWRASSGRGRGTGLDPRVRAGVVSDATPGLVSSGIRPTLSDLRD